MIKTLTQDRFAIPLKIIGVYLLWRVVHYFAITENNPLYSYWQQWCIYLGSFYAHFTAVLLSLVGTKTSAEGININLLESNKQIWVQEHCLAIPAMVIFTATVVFIKGKWENKLWFIPLGLAGVMFINVTRLVFVSLSFAHFSAHFFQMNHSLIYVAVTYGCIFAMLVWWVGQEIKQKSVDT